MMWCRECGAHLKDGAAFCQNCGTLVRSVESSFPAQTLQFNIPLATQNIPIRKKIKILPVLIVSSAVVAICILAWIFSPILFSDSKVDMMTGSVLVLKSQDEFSFLINNYYQEGYGVGRFESVSNMQHSLDGETAAAIVKITDTDEGLYFLMNSGRKTGIYFVSGDIYCFQISDSGNSVAYMKDFDEDTQTGTLYLYDCNSDKNEKIADGVYAQQNFMYGCISPDGKTVAYITNLDPNKLTFVSHMKTVGKSTIELGDNILPVAMANGGELIYSYKISGNSMQMSADLLAMKGGQSIKLAQITGSSPAIHFFFNSDRSQLLYSSSGKTYLSINGSEGKKISDSETEQILQPDFAQLSQINTPVGDFTILGMKDFSRLIIETADNAILFVGKDGETLKISDHPKQCIVANDCKTVFVIDQEDTLYQYTISDTLIETDRLLNVKQMVASADGMRYCYITDDGELIFAVNSNTHKDMASNVDRMSLSSDGHTLYYMTDYNGNSGILYSSRDGSTALRLSDNAYSVMVTPVGALYFTNYNSTGETFIVYHEEGGKFDQLDTNITAIQ